MFKFGSTFKWLYLFRFSTVFNDFRCFSSSDSRLSKTHVDLATRFRESSSPRALVAPPGRCVPQVCWCDSCVIQEQKPPKNVFQNVLERSVYKRTLFCCSTVPKTGRFGNSEDDFHLVARQQCCSVFFMTL